MKSKTALFLLLLTLIFTSNGTAAEFSQGAVRLVLDESSGRFSLYALADDGKAVALFSDRDIRTSFLSVIVNDRSYKMGDSSAFKVSIAGNSVKPSLVYESAALAVITEFSFFKTMYSPATNGVSVSITLENRGDRQISAGARFLLDTCLGEKSPASPITTNTRSVVSEILLTGIDSDYRWTDRNDAHSLTGSLGAYGNADSVHIANWKKLSDVTWKASYQPGRNFNFLPYSLNDTAVCYYFEAKPLMQGEKRSFGFSLAINDETGFPRSSPVAAPLPFRTNIPNTGISEEAIPAINEEDLEEINKLIDRINAHIESGTATDEDLVTLELALNRLRAKYGSGADIR